MKRLPDWQERLAVVIDAASRKKFVLGQHDCFTLAIEGWIAVYGEDLSKRLNNVRYSNPKEIVRELARHGKTAEDAADWFFGKRVPVLQAKRGHVAIYKGPSGQKHLAIVDHGLLAFSVSGLMRVPLTLAHAAWGAD